MNVSTVWIRVARRIRDAHWLLKLGKRITANDNKVADFGSFMDTLMGAKELAVA